jgi:hypothetical protein
MEAYLGSDLIEYHEVAPLDQCSSVLNWQLFQTKISGAIGSPFLTLQSVQFLSFEGFFVPPHRAQCHNVTLNLMLMESMMSNNRQNLTLDCHAREWKVYWCPPNPHGSSDGHRATCVDCDDPCVEEFTCSGRHLTISPCQAQKCSENEASSNPYRGVRALGFGFFQKYPAPEILSISVKPGSTNITIGIELDDEVGEVYCAAFQAADPDLFSVITSSDIEEQRYLSASNNGSANIQISGLYQSTQYILSCFTKSTISEAVMSNSKIWELADSIPPVTTLPYRPLLIEYAGTPYALKDTYTPRFLKVSLNYIPKGESR